MADRSSRPPRWRRRDVLLVAGSAYLLVSVGTLIHQEVRLQRYTVDLHQQRQAVEDERHQLNRQLALYKEDAGVERLARQQLGMARADELPVRFVESPKAAMPPKAPKP
jgi:cell division protein FtsB